MPRRIHLSQNLTSGSIQLDEKQAHHLRDVLRAEKGDQIELFDDAGHVATAIIEHCEKEGVRVRVEQVNSAKTARQVVIASAVPKGNRADWMVEKLSELGVSRFIPLQSERSVVLPAGKGKYERWRRIAEESAKQSRRAGVMQIDELMELEALLSPSPQWGEGRGEGRKLKPQSASVSQSTSSAYPSPQPSPLRGEGAGGFFLSTEPDSTPLASCSSFLVHPSAFLFIGPEGGWSPDEIARMKFASLTPAKLTGTILRVETAAVLAAGIVLSAPDQ